MQWGGRRQAVWPSGFGSHITLMPANFLGKSDLYLPSLRVVSAEGAILLWVIYLTNAVFSLLVHWCLKAEICFREIKPLCSILTHTSYLPSLGKQGVIPLSLQCTLPPHQLENTEAAYKMLWWIKARYRGAVPCTLPVSQPLAVGAHQTSSHLVMKYNRLLHTSAEMHFLYLQCFTLTSLSEI